MVGENNVIGCWFDGDDASGAWGKGSFDAHVLVLDSNSDVGQGFAELGEENGFVEGADLMGIFDDAEVEKGFVE